MMNIKNKIKKFYINFIVRPINLNIHIISFVYKKVILFFYVRGFHLPGIKKILHKLNSDFKQKLERQKLVYEIKLNRFRFRLGPLWFRSIADKFNIFIQKNRFIVLIFLKSTVSAFCIFIPIYIFILVRGILPVPERVPYQAVEQKLVHNYNSHTDYPYIQITDDQNQKNPQQFKIGFPAFKVNLLNGFLFSEKSPLFLQNNLNFEHENFENSNLRFNYYLYSSDSKPYSCVLQVFNENNELLAQNTIVTPKLESASKYSIKNSWRRAFTPNIMPSYGHVYEFNISGKKLPNQLILKTFPVLAEEQNSSVTTKCQIVASDFTYNHRVKNPKLRRGMIFIVVDGLENNIAYNRKLMPNLNRLMSFNSIIFRKHYLQSIQNNFTAKHLFTSRYFSEQSEYNLPNTLKNLGYRVGGIGAISDEIKHATNQNWGFDQGLLTENSRYNGRYVTEFAGQWLNQYGSDPFFLYVHYSALRPPYKPPFEYLNLTRLLSHPFGVAQKKQLYNGVVRYFDDEINLLFQKLKDLDLLDKIDIVITSNPNLSDDANIILNSKQLLTPLWIKKAGTEKAGIVFVDAPTSHFDLFPSIADYMGHKEINFPYRGRNFSYALQHPNSEVFQKILNKNQNLLFESENTFGIFDPFSYKNNLYIRNINNSSNTLRQNQFTNFQLIKEYFDKNPSEKLFKMHFAYDGNTNFTFTFTDSSKRKSFIDNEKPEFLKFPENLKGSIVFNNGVYKINVSGVVKQKDEIIINFKHLKFLSSNFENLENLFLCPEGVTFSQDFLVKALNTTLCPYLNVQNEYKKEIELQYENPIYGQLILKNEIKEYQ